MKNPLHRITPLSTAISIMSAEHTYKFNVSMSCGGCSGAVDRVLKKLDGMCLPLPSPLYPYLDPALPFLRASLFLDAP